MTDKKKFKKRVRARMAETGQRYTEVRSEDKSVRIGATVRKILTLWKKRQVQEIFDLVQGIYNESQDENARPSSWTIAAATVLELLSLEEDPTALVRDVLMTLMSGGEIEGSRVFEAPQRSTLKVHLEDLMPSTSSWFSVPERASEFDPSDEDYFEDHGARKTSARNIHREAHELEGVWDRAPDVSAAFGAESSPRRHEPSGSWFHGEAFFYQRAQVRKQNALLQEYVDENERLRAALVARGVDPDDV